MLEGLYVKNLAIIDEIRVSFGKGLNILTGETGAGKSVIIGSINLALGAKASKQLIRKGKDFALVELIFSVEKEFSPILQAMDIFPEEGMVTIARRIGMDRSINRINGETVPLAKAREVSSLLLDLHGQQENHSLLSSKNHLEILDRYCKKEIESLKANLKVLTENYRKKMEEFKSYSRDEVSAERELDFLRYECEEIKKAGLREGEEEELERKVKKYSFSSKIMDILREIEEAMSSRGGIEEAVGKITKQLGRLLDFDKGSGEIYNQISEIEALLGDFQSSLSSYAEENVFDEEDFRKSEERLDYIRSIYVKHGGNYISTMDYFEEATEKIEKLENRNEYKEKLTKEVEELKAEILEECETLSQDRKDAAKEFEKQVKSALCDLNFLQVEFEVKFSKMKEFSAKGFDEVTFLISANPGESPRAISEIASGGELSRIMLAIKSVMADTDKIPTLIFDEVDAGISGRTAQMVSEKMTFLSKSRQIIAITHLAQIAAMADHHYLIEKNLLEGHTATEIRELSRKEITKELARILGGAEITESVLVSAEEMKKLADETKRKMIREK